MCNQVCLHKFVILVMSQVTFCGRLGLFVVSKVISSMQKAIYALKFHIKAVTRPFLEGNMFVWNFMSIEKKRLLAATFCLTSL